MGFYNKKEEEDRKNYIPVLRKKMLEHLDDLRKKIEKDEDFPHGKQDIDTLAGIDDHITECLNNWYY